ncbi:hypothetical protein M406DRAFT_321479 [Cryphonectria parasitica EP155]|uniref:Blue (type 1) copper domain-containing protein n=1 Tax=Cryphonectria parasitica (strain ATCC 38755 / EP155) TaxID=660469 RepID=A0A9P5CQD6_CRYP1|nr:uncharacterized protein M406DRAFT_321479 [Cryphonectria parasitica EP155]KAF3767118.1 hypothetical protein M406DRAFT_321479 [Cryphonectria parasitica EP155]
MQPSLIRGLLLAAWSADLVAAKTIKIEAGDVYFDPVNVNASVGDVLEFHFLPHNHSVVMGDLSSACQPAATGGFYSGFLPASSGENVSKPAQWQRGSIAMAARHEHETDT